MNRVVHLPLRKTGVVDQVDQERNIRFHAADAKFLQAPFHAASGIDKRKPCAVTFTRSES